MLELYMRISFILFAILTAAKIFGLIPLLFIQSFIYKKLFDPIYFNNNHYSDYELSIFNSFPLFLIKTLGYIKAITFLNTMRMKFEKNILNNKEKPFIYFLAWMTMLIIIYGGVVIINFFIVGGFMYFNGLL